MDEKWLPLLAMGAGLLGQGQQGGRPTFASSLGQGLLGGLQGYQMMQGIDDDKRQRRLQELQLSLASVRAQREAAQDSARQLAFATATKGMDPQKAALLQAGGPEALSSYVATQFAAPKPPTSRTINLGGQEITQEWNPQTGGWTEIGRGSRWAPQQPTQGPEMWSILDPEKAKGLGLQGVWQISNRNQFKRIDDDGASGGETWEVVSSDDPIMANFAPGTVVGRSNKNDIKVLQQPKGGGLNVKWGEGGDLESISLGGEGGDMTGKGSQSLTTPNVTGVQKDVIGLGDQAARLDAIKNSFRPEYQQLGQRFGNAWTAGKEKLGMSVAPEDQAALGNYTTYRADAINNLNQIMKEQSGSAVTGNEFERNTAALPNAGTGVFDGDSPTEFQAKLNASINRVRLAEARKKFLLARGIQFDFSAGNTGGVGLEDMPRIIDAEGARIEQELIQQGVPPAEAEQKAAQQLKATFGL